MPQPLVCSNCRNALYPNAVGCHHCGAVFYAPPPLPLVARVPPQLYCSRCRAALYPNATGCHHCGALFYVPPAPPESTPAMSGSAGEMPAIDAVAPVAAIGMIAVMAAMLLMEVILSDGAWSGLLEIPVKALVEAGGVSWSLVVEHGQYGRLLSAMFLHGDAMHFALNGWCLYQAGKVLEPQVGRTLFLVYFVVAGLLGGIFSVVFNDPQVVSVGASGGAMGLLAASMVHAVHFPHTRQRDDVLAWSASLLVASLLPLREGIDYAAHAGGALGGAILAGLVMMVSRGRAIAPRRDLHGGIISAIAVGALLLLVPSGVTAWPVDPPPDMLDRSVADEITDSAPAGLDTEAMSTDVMSTDVMSTDATSVDVTGDDPRTPVFSEQIVACVLAGRKIAAIKLVREQFGLGLKESTDIIDALADELRATEPSAGAVSARADGCRAKS